MAKFLSQVYTIIRGSVGGITYTANAFSQLVARARTSPVNPQTNYQTLIRSAFTQGSGFWKNLTDAVRAGWNAYAETLQFQGPLGPYTIPGRNVFIAVASFVSYINLRAPGTLVFSTAAPTIGGFLDIGDVQPATYVGPGTGVAISVSNFTGEDAYLLVTRSIGFNASRVSPPNKYDSASTLVVSSPNGVSTLVEFDGLTEDAIYFIKVRAVTAAGPFRYSPESVLRTVAITVP